MEATAVVCLPLRPPRPCQPENSWKIRETAHETQCAVRCAVQQAPLMSCNVILVGRDKRIFGSHSDRGGGLPPGPPSPPPLDPHPPFPPQLKCS